MRSARVDLPWSMWAMMLKLRMWSMGRGEYEGRGASARGALRPVRQTQATGGSCRRGRYLRWMLGTSPGATRPSCGLPARRGMEVLRQPEHDRGGLAQDGLSSSAFGPLD